MVWLVGFVILGESEMMVKYGPNLWATYFFFVQTMHERDREGDIEGLVWRMTSDQGLEARITCSGKERKNDFYPIEMSCHLEIDSHVDLWFAPEICLQVTRTATHAFRLLFCNSKGVPYRIIENAEGFTCGSNSRDNRPVHGVENLFLYVTGEDRKIHCENMIFDTAKNRTVVPFRRHHSNTES